MIDSEYSIDQKPELILLSTPLSTPVYAGLRPSTPEVPIPAGGWDRVGGGRQIWTPGHKSHKSGFLSTVRLRSVYG